VTRVHKDIGAMLLTALAVLVLAATDRGWGVLLVAGGAIAGQPGRSCCSGWRPARLARRAPALAPGCSRGSAR
jgi:hypothetical protein